MYIGFNEDNSCCLHAPADAPIKISYILKDMTTFTCLHLIRFYAVPNLGSNDSSTCNNHGLSCVRLNCCVPTRVVKTRFSKEMLVLTMQILTEEKPLHCFV